MSSKFSFFLTPIENDEFQKCIFYFPLLILDEGGNQRVVDLIICLGGDGTLLHVSSMFQVLILCNFSRLGRVIFP